MGRKIFKYRVKMEPFTLGLPEMHIVVHVAEQEGKPQMWVFLDPNDKTYTHDFVVRGTGHEVKDNERWCGTWQSPPFVWHLFRRDNA